MPRETKAKQVYLSFSALERDLLSWPFVVQVFGLRSVKARRRRVRERLDRTARAGCVFLPVILARLFEEV